MRHLVVIVAFSIALSSTGAAQPARELYESGLRHYNLQEYEPALADFKAAYQRSGAPELLYNLGQCYRALGDPARAAAHYRAYLRELGNASNRHEVERLIAAMDSAIAAQKQPPTGVPPAPTALNDSKPNKQTETKPNKQTETRPSPQAETKSNTQPDTQAEPKPEPRPMAKATVAPSVTREAPPRPWYKRSVAWALAVPGVVLAAAGAGLLVHARSVASQAPTDLDTRDSFIANANAFQAAGIATVSVGAAGLLSGVVMLAVPQARAHGVTAGLRLTPGGALLSVGGSL
jgi:hypothetical protein